jgi:glycosyltransferase involved in cell wall biosynthesis
MPVRVVPAHGVGGGMERVTWTLASRLAGRGHDVTVATTSNPAGLVETEDDGVRVLHLSGSTWRRYRAAWWEAAWVRLAAEHRAHPYDVVLSQSAGGLGYVAAAHGRLRLPVAVLLHGSARGDLRTAWRGARSPRGGYRLARLGWRLPRLLWLWRQAAPSVAAWMAVSTEVAADSRRELGLGPSIAVTVVPPGADTERFRPDASARAAVRAELGIDPAAPVVAVVSRLEREKGVAVALEAAGRLRERLPDLVVVVAGTGHDERRLRRLAARLGLGPACRFLGLVGHDRLPAVLAAADVFAHASLCAEGRPTSMVEAAATGLPVVATASAGSGEVVVDGVTGLLVRRGDAAGMAAAMTRALTDDVARAAMGRAGRELAATAWCAAAQVDVVEAALSSAAAAPRVPG